MTRFDPCREYSSSRSTVRHLACGRSVLHRDCPRPARRRVRRARPRAGHESLSEPVVREQRPERRGAVGVPRREPSFRRLGASALADSTEREPRVGPRRRCLPHADAFPDHRRARCPSAPCVPRQGSAAGGHHRGRCSGDADADRPVLHPRAVAGTPARNGLRTVRLRAVRLLRCLTDVQWRRRRGRHPRQQRHFETRHGREPWLHPHEQCRDHHSDDVAALGHAR